MPEHKWREPQAPQAQLGAVIAGRGECQRQYGFFRGPTPLEWISDWTCPDQ